MLIKNTETADRKVTENFYTFDLAILINRRDIAELINSEKNKKIKKIKKLDLFFNKSLKFATKNIAEEIFEKH